MIVVGIRTWTGYSTMENVDDSCSLAKCRERRRRRIEMRRASITGSSPPVNEIKSSDGGEEVKRVRRTGVTDASSTSGNDAEASSATALIEIPATDWTPVAGFISVAGRSREMQDAVCVQTGFCQPEIFRRRPLHFYAVYDGHGGSHVATLCSEKVHMHLKEELMRMESTRHSVGARNTEAMQETQQQIQGAEEEKEVWRRALKRSFKRTDEMALIMCPCGRVGYQCELHSKEEVMLVGSTAVVAVLTPDHIIVANCGDSRAVLCRSGISIPLSDDHKPDRLDERARIEACNGRVIFRNGARVEGILAVSRAIGDKYLKPSVTSEPEITFTKRDPGDECLILASDGLWDVVKNETACNVALQCLREGSPPVAATYRNTETRIEDARAGALFTSQSELAAAILARLALGRMSGDNISVIVVDLRGTYVI